MKLLFPAKYEIWSKCGPAQRGTLTISAHTGREARILAMEQIQRLCGLLPAKLEIGRPL